MCYENVVCLKNDVKSCCEMVYHESYNFFTPTLSNVVLDIVEDKWNIQLDIKSACKMRSRSCSTWLSLTDLDYLWNCCKEKISLTRLKFVFSPLFFIFPVRLWLSRIRLRFSRV